MAERQSTPDQEIDAVDLLLQQHAQMEDLFRLVLATAGRARREAFTELARLLVMHETVEEEVVHPTARRLMAEGDAVIDARLEEEIAAQALLRRLAEVDINTDDFDALLVALRDEVLAHARREEQYEFGYLRENLTFDELQNLGTAVITAAAVVPSWEYPDPETAVAGRATAGPYALADQIRAVLRHP